jgi:hypothetical protein
LGVSSVFHLRFFRGYFFMAAFAEGIDLSLEGGGSG